LATQPPSIQIQHMGFAGNTGGLRTGYNIADDMIISQILSNEEVLKRRSNHYVGEICEE